MVMICSRAVFRCFKALERLGDRITGAAGPFFVAMAVLLIGSGMFAFFEVIAPTLRFPLLSIPLCLLIALNLGMHYYYVCTIPPGFVADARQPYQEGFLWAKPRTRQNAYNYTNNRQENGSRSELPGGIQITPAKISKCRKCGETRPERAHHCRICKKCVLKYDHHCPWINQCVGINNERHFVLFMAYLVLSGFCFAFLGYPKVLVSLGIGIAYGTSFANWEYYTPPILFVLLFVLAAVLSFAVGVMCSYHVYTVCRGETTVEAQDFEVYRKWAGSNGDEFQNSYDLGRMKNLQVFLGLVDYPTYTLFVPLRLRPYTDGWSWARKPGCEALGLSEDHILTDEGEDI